MSEPRLTLVARARTRFERWREDLQHRFRTRLTTRNKVFAWSTLALVVGAAVVLAVRPGAWSWSVFAAVATGVLVVRAAMLRSATPPHVHGLPGYRDARVCPPREAAASDPFVRGVRGVGLFLALLVAFGLPAAAVWAGVVVLVIVAAPVIVDKIRLWGARLLLRRALASWEPRFIVGYGGYGGGPIHVGMWEPHLLASGERGLIVGIRPHYCAELRAAIKPQMPWLSTGSDVLGDMRVLTVPTLTTFFYVHNAPGHLKLQGIRRVRHVWLGHGDSDKAGSHHTRHLNYDVLVASGEAAVDRYVRHGVDIPRDRFVLLGRPQSGDVLPAERPVTQVARPTVLYTPTWTGNGKMANFSSIRQARKLLKTLIAADVDVIFRPHPVFLREEYWHDRIAALDALLAADDADPANDRHHAWGEDVVRTWSVADCMNRADVLVSDVSSVVSDWLASGKPYLMVSMQHDLDDFAVEVPVAAGGYVVDRELTGLAEVLDDVLHRDPLDDERRRLKVHVLGEYEGTESAQAFAAWVAQTVRTPFERAHAGLPQ